MICGKICSVWVWKFVQHSYMLTLWNEWNFEMHSQMLVCYRKLVQSMWDVGVGNCWITAKGRIEIFCKLVINALCFYWQIFDKACITQVRICYELNFKTDKQLLVLVVKYFLLALMFESRLGQNTYGAAYGNISYWKWKRVWKLSELGTIHACKKVCMYVYACDENIFDWLCSQFFPIHTWHT